MRILAVVSVPAIRRSSVSAESSSIVGLTCPFSASGLSAVSKIVGRWSEDKVDRSFNSSIRSRATLNLQRHLLGIRNMERRLFTFMHHLVSASGFIYLSRTHNGRLSIH